MPFGIEIIISVSAGTVEVKILSGFRPPPPMHPGSDAYVESGGGVPKSDFGFDSNTIRAAFIRKVFILVGIMVSFKVEVEIILI